MTKRPIFLATNKAPYYREFNVTFDWNPGFAKSQKQKNIQAMHLIFLRTPIGKDKRILEISSKSTEDLGVNLSAFNLQKYVPSLGRKVPLECVFQGGKVFENGGPYLDLYEMKPADAKKDERLRDSGRLTAFRFEGKDYPLKPLTIFYDWLYLNACLENPELSEPLLKYDGFTDIEFNPEKSINCQARSAAIYVSLNKTGLIDQIRSFEAFREYTDISKEVQKAVF